VRSSPPWGVTISSIPMVAAGPNARGEICSHPRAAGERDVWDHLAARRSFELGFACGVLPALRGGALVDDCTGEVMLELAPLGLAVSAPAPGAPLDETLLRNYLGGHTECARLFVTNVAATQPALDAAFARLGAKLTAAISREGLSQPSR
jgi:hypothetical protein